MTSQKMLPRKIVGIYFSEVIAYKIGTSKKRLPAKTVGNYISEAIAFKN